MRYKVDGDRKMVNYSGKCLPLSKKFTRKTSQMVSVLDPIWGIRLVEIQK
jgi:hypothetical protein